MGEPAPSPQGPGTPVGQGVRGDVERAERRGGDRGLHHHGVLATVRSNARTEGLNRLIKAVKRSACGILVTDAVADNQWSREGRRSDGAAFTVETLARYLLHDIVHPGWDVTPGSTGT